MKPLLTTFHGFSCTDARSAGYRNVFESFSFALGPLHGRSDALPEVSDGLSGMSCDLASRRLHLLSSLFV